MKTYKRRCKKKDCWKKANGINIYCTIHQTELEAKAVKLLTQQKQ